MNMRIFIVVLCVPIFSWQVSAYDGEQRCCTVGVCYAAHKRPHADAVDIRLTCYGKHNTNLFVGSPYLIRQCVGSLIAAAHESGGMVTGVNLYFPDFDFSQKRDMAQLAKSVSLLIDSLPLQDIRDLRFYLSFDKANGERNRSYLCALTQMADSVLLMDSHGSMLPDVLDHSDAAELNIFLQLKNQLSLARYHTEPFPECSTDMLLMSDVAALMDADYPDNQWEVFLLALLAVFFVVLALLLLYAFNPIASFYISKNMDYVYSLVVMLSLEVLLLAANMLESMSKDSIFTLDSENKYVMLLLPLLFIFVIPMMKAVGKKRHLP